MNAYSNPQTNSRALVEQTAILCSLIGFGALGLLVTVILLGATLLGMTFAQWGAAIIVGGASLTLAALIVRTWQNIRWLLVEPVAVIVARQYEEEPTGQTVNAKGHARVIVNNAPAIQQTQEVIRLVQVNAPGRLVEGVAEADLADFIDRVFIVGHSQRALMGYRLPSGKIIDTFETYDDHIQPLVKAGIIADRGERRKGRLTVGSAQEAREILGLSPKV